MSAAKVEVDWSKLAKQIKSLADLAGGKFIAAAAKGLANQTMANTLRQILMRQAPSGHRWRPFKKGGGSSFASALISATSETVSPTGFNVETSASWAAYHQRGAKRAFKNQETNNLLKKLLKAKDKPGIEALFAKAKESKGQDPSLLRSKWKLPIRRILPKRQIPKRWEQGYIVIVEKLFKEFLQEK